MRAHADLSEKTAMLSFWEMFSAGECVAVCYRGTSPIRNSAPLGPYHRTMPRALWKPLGGGAVSYERGDPVARAREGRLRNGARLLQSRTWQETMPLTIDACRAGGLGFRVKAIMIYRCQNAPPGRGCCTTGRPLLQGTAHPRTLPQAYA